jgi:hypothetical protein
MNLAPVALFVYNRLDHTKKTVEALGKNYLAEESQLFVFSDGYKNEEGRDKVEEVRKYIKTITGFKSIEVFESDKNNGLANSIITGVTMVVNKFGRVIVMEDDLVTSPYFLTYMNEALDLYEEEEKVASIHGYVYPVKKPLPETFFLRGADCWGWATWKRAWAWFEPDGAKLLAELENKKLTYKFDFDGNFHFTNMLKRQIAGETNSWAIRWHASCFLKEKLTLYPGLSLLDNIGQDDSGTHRAHKNIHSSEIYKSKIKVGGIPIEESQEAREIIKRYLKLLRPSMQDRLIKFLKKLV